MRATAVALPAGGARLQRPFVVSLAAHLAIAAVALWWISQAPPVGPPPARRSYSVNLVEPPGLRGGPARRTAPVPKTDAVRARARTGVKVDQAPSTETLSPKGVKTPTRTRGQTGGEALPTSGGRGRGAGQGLRLEGEPFPYPEYLVGMQAAIDSLWERPLVAGVLKTTVYFAILRSGQIDEALVEVGSGVRLFDRKALEAVVNASPLPPLPEGFKGAQLGVHLDFENEN